MDRKEEFKLLYKENYKKVYNLALGLTSDSDKAEEITQEAFFYALKSFDDFFVTFHSISRLIYDMI